MDRNQTATHFLMPILALVLAAAVGLGCNPNQAANAAGDDPREAQAVNVEIATVGRGDIQQTYRTITTLEAERMAKIVARTSGILQSIAVEEGDFVAEGQVLAQLDTEQLQLQVAQLEALVKRLAADLEREKALVARKLGTTTNLERARSEYESQKAQYDIARLNWRYATIRAPFSGLITRREVRAGNLIQVNDELFTLVDPDSLQAVLHLPQKELANTAVGQAASVTVDSFPDTVIPGVVERIRPQIDVDTGTFQVVVGIDNPDGRFKAGMFGRVELILGTRNHALLLTRQALVTEDNRSHVFIVRDGTAVQTPVQVGIKQHGTVEVLSGLQEGDQVIVTGQTVIKDGSPVEVIGA